jgi:hypothetical protein
VSRPRAIVVPVASFSVCAHNYSVTPTLWESTQRLADSSGVLPHPPPRVPQTMSPMRRGPERRRLPSGTRRGSTEPEPSGGPWMVTVSDRFQRILRQENLPADNLAEILPSQIEEAEGQPATPTPWTEAPSSSEERVPAVPDAVAACLEFTARDARPAQSLKPRRPPIEMRLTRLQWKWRPRQSHVGSGRPSSWRCGCRWTTGQWYGCRRWHPWPDSGSSSHGFPALSSYSASPTCRERPAGPSSRRYCAWSDEPSSLLLRLPQRRRGVFDVRRGRRARCSELSRLEAIGTLASSPPVTPPLSGR